MQVQTANINVSKPKEVTFVKPTAHISTRSTTRQKQVTIEKERIIEDGLDRSQWNKEATDQKIKSINEYRASVLSKHPELKKSILVEEGAAVLGYEEHYATSIFSYMLTLEFSTLSELCKLDDIMSNAGKRTPSKVKPVLNSVAPFIFVSTRVPPNQLVTQEDRTKLLDNLLSISRCFDLFHESVMCMITLLDLCTIKWYYYLPKKNYKLLGYTAMLLATKFEEIYPPAPSDIIQSQESASNGSEFTTKQLINSEWSILRAIKFNMTWSAPITFLRRFTHVMRHGSNEHSLGKYILELSLYDTKVCSILPSIRAAAASMLSSCIFACYDYEVELAGLDKSENDENQENIENKASLDNNASPYNDLCGLVKEFYDGDAAYTLGCDMDNLLPALHQYCVLLCKQNRDPKRSIKQKYAAPENRCIANHEALRIGILEQMIEQFNPKQNNKQ